MLKMALKKMLYKIMPLFCIVILTLSLILPYDLFWKINHITPLGLSTIFICPIASLVGMISSVRNKKGAYFFLNVLFFFSFPLMMLLGNEVCAL